jgi:hypothetical protein
MGSEKLVLQLKHDSFFRLKHCLPYFASNS